MTSPADCLVLLHLFTFDVVYRLFLSLPLFLGFYVYNRFGCLKESDRRATGKHMFASSSQSMGAQRERSLNNYAEPCLVLTNSRGFAIDTSCFIHVCLEEAIKRKNRYKPCVKLPRGFAPNIAKLTFALRPSMIGFGSLQARSALNLSPMITWEE